MSLLQRSSVTRLFYLLLVLAAFALRLTLLDAQSLWYDEGVSAMVGQMAPGALIRWTADDIQPPLYYLNLALWGRLAGWSEWSLRYLSAWCGLLAVPLMTVLALRFRPRATVALIAALLAGFHPLLIYYSQEARMYAMLTALALLAGYLLIRHAQTRRPVLLSAYVIAAVAAVYTHYFAFFLLLALALAYLLDRSIFAAGEDGTWWAHVRLFIGANVLIVVAYLPWFWAMLRRLAMDTSYWQGRLKVTEALRNVLVTFVSGETVAAGPGLWIMFVGSAIALLAAVRLWRFDRRGRRILLWSLLWLVVPMLGVILLASFAPKFNPRYVLIALPGLLLLWSTGLAPTGRAQTDNNLVDSPIRPTDDAQGARSSLRPHPEQTSVPWTALRATIRHSPLLMIALIFLLSTSLYATFNWFTDPAFRKDQWRELTTDLRMRVGPEEVIVLVSGHAWPVWDYYAPDLPAVYLPELEILDVDAVLDFAETAAPLQDALGPLADRPGAWLVGWQDEVVDPMGIVPAQLELAGREKGMDSAYWGIDLRRFSQLKVNWIPDTAPVEFPLDVTFVDGAGQPVVTLVGYNSLDNGGLLLFWQLARPAVGSTPDLYIAGQTLDANGAVVGTVADRRAAGYTFPSFRWGEDRIAVSNLTPPDWLGDAPQGGEYVLELRVYDAARRNEPLQPMNGTVPLSIGPIDVVID